ncbi:MAG: SURF1 family protein [Chromatiaceae bacterium]|nr:SURF1 family protein [Chromatiaceae bacterium]MCP5422203.1 SURF1 family protein [Chromatiaceae bacterium]
MNIPSITVGRYRFAPALWPTVAFVLLFPGLLALGAWQMERAHAKQLLVEQRAATELATPLAIGRDTLMDVTDRYRQATVRGHYVGEQQWLLDNRVFRGQAGYHVFTPFAIDGGDGAMILVNRGWVAVGASRDFLPQLPVSDESVMLTGRLDSPASVALVIGEVPLHSVADRVLVQSLDVAALGAARGMNLKRYTLVLDEDQAGGLQYDWSPIPEMGPEKHLGYAVQWFGLAIALLLIYVGVNTRRNDPNGGKHAQA